MWGGTNTETHPGLGRQDGGVGSDKMSACGTASPARTQGQSPQIQRRQWEGDEWQQHGRRNDSQRAHILERQPAYCRTSALLMKTPPYVDNLNIKEILLFPLTIMESLVTIFEGSGSRTKRDR